MGEALLNQFLVLRGYIKVDQISPYKNNAEVGLEFKGYLNLDRPVLDNLVDLAENLPVDQKAELVQRLLGQQSGLSVVFGNNQLSGSIIVQINTTDRESLGDILDAIASRITKEES